MFYNYVYSQQPKMQLPIYASLHFQTCGILTVLTSESARVSDFSPHVFFAVKSHLWAHSCYGW